MNDARSLFEEAGRTRPVFRDPDPTTAATRTARAIALYERAAKLGHVEAMRELVGMLLAPTESQRRFEWSVCLAKLGGPEPLARALDDLPAKFGRNVRAAADGAEAWAQSIVADLYGTALPPPESTGLPAVEAPGDEADRWWTRAAEQGWAPAQLALADSLAATNPQAGVTWAQQGLAAIEEYPALDARLACRTLVLLLERTKAPMSERIRAAERAADLDDAEAMTWLGDRHRLGEGVPRDPAKARAWYDRATKGKGDRQGDAWRELGKMFEGGEGGSADEEKARQCYENAADLSYDAFARKKLATKYGQTRRTSGTSDAGSTKKKAASAKRKGKVSAKRAKT